jgi:hypothetical protein
METSVVSVFGCARKRIVWIAGGGNAKCNFRDNEIGRDLFNNERYKIPTSMRLI